MSSSSNLSVIQEKRVEEQMREKEEDLGSAESSMPQPNTDTPPDGGYGWVIVACLFLANVFPGSTDVDFAFIGGLAVGGAMMMAPFSNYLSKRYHFKIPLILGVVMYVLAQIFAGLSTRIWQLFLTQGLMFGMGLGLIFIPTAPLSNEWFSRKRAYATVSRSHMTQGRFEPIQYQLLWHPGFVWVWSWGCFAVTGYILALYTTATYATLGLGLSQSQAATIQSVIAAGQIVGRPLSGFAMDKGGRFNIATLWTFIAGLSCFVIWMVSRSFGVLVFFSLIQGMFGGIFWSSCSPLTTEAVGLKDLGSALSILWLTIVPSCILAEPIAIWLLQASQRQLGIFLPEENEGKVTGTTAGGISGAGSGDTRGAVVFEATIGFAGATFIVGSVLLYCAKRWKQGNWRLFIKT
ncbi:hypothetical protein Clacol_005947 [Clathrus columnatus]|uniref:Uncharacterized protein n=1 Tax=Clathrus columnatus TaxID=1419009 RepID=A0AAV5AIE3_9AGAM|nr:hypothetical protein Clacol_005947 [Clathrus columnatus]